MAVALGLAMAGCGGSGHTTGTAATKGGAFSIGLWGDTPYTPAEAIAVPKLVDQVNSSDVDFTVFIGDLQGGDRCVNQLYTTAADTFNSFAKPMVYTPGDNEWTDCHVTAGDPIERLAYIRRTMFATNRSFGQQTLTVEQQPQYPENARWVSHAVQFVTLDVPGSNDNHIADPDADEQNTPRTAADRRAAEAEYQARDQADRDWLHQAFGAATAANAPAVVIAMQADPAFDVAPASRSAMGVDGFDKLLAAFVSEAKAFGKPVVILHGDSHRERFDHPLVDPATGQPVPNVTRVETFGSPNVGWVKVTFDPADPVFVSIVPHAVAGPAAS
ncbi:MAG TPA: hypothetical protein VHT97_14590 [Acidimicrobiales bacterium]|nr:hypothetical protein [Acidimicrobiales bacterium]